MVLPTDIQPQSDTKCIVYNVCRAVNKVKAYKKVFQQYVRTLEVTGVCSRALLLLLAAAVVSQQDTSLCPLLVPRCDHTAGEHTMPLWPEQFKLKHPDQKGLIRLEEQELIKQGLIWE